MENSDLSGRRIMIVEDEVLLAMLVEDQLLELGCLVVAQAASVGDGLAELERATLDAAVLDVNLYGERSYPIAEALAARGVPYLFTTGHGHAGLDPAFQDQPVLQKPFSTEDLGAALARLLSGSGAPAG